jgi:hypothetical protein
VDISYKGEWGYHQGLRTRVGGLRPLRKPS